MLHFFVKDKPDQFSLYALKFRTVRAHEHADYLLYHVKRLDPERHIKTANRSCDLKIPHALFCELYVGSSVPVTSFIVTTFAECICSCSTLLLPPIHVICIWVASSL